ncbi:ABC transporter permease [Nocardioides alcanivorans]|uniref:ABC transporter permease n=1 Tax=Nocardioides alcanivorans TaxID=2897352 RepID=UPI001F353A9A|nr:ABC transporter permease [Nocardioides alcanivorans]
MVRYVVRRLPSALITLFLASILVFILVRLVPGDPVATLAGPDASAETRDAIRSQLGLDGSPITQYFHWLGSMATGDFGTSYMIGGSISELVGAGALNTVVLAGTALLIAAGIALVVGVASVLSQSRVLDAIVSAMNTVAVALPPFVTGVVLVVLFAVTWPLLPAGGVPPQGFWASPDITVQYLILPAICLSLPGASVLTRFLTESLRSELRQPYVTTARALGISRRRIVLTQALPNALPATVTVLGLQVGALLGGAVLIELIFAWPGLGMLVEQAISNRDYPLVQVLLLLSVAVFVVVQVLTDVVHAWLDPRVRLGAAA